MEKTPVVVDAVDRILIESANGNASVQSIAPVVLNGIRGCGCDSQIISKENEDAVLDMIRMIPDTCREPTVAKKKDLAQSITNFVLKKVFD